MNEKSITELIERTILLSKNSSSVKHDMPTIAEHIIRRKGSMNNESNLHNKINYILIL